MRVSWSQPKISVSLSFGCPPYLKPVAGMSMLCKAICQKLSVGAQSGITQRVKNLTSSSATDSSSSPLWIEETHPKVFKRQRFASLGYYDFIPLVAKIQ